MTAADALVVDRLVAGYGGGDVLHEVSLRVRMMNADGKTVLLVEQNARAGLRLSQHGVVMENGRVRLTGTGAEVLSHPEIAALYLGGCPGNAS